MKKIKSLTLILFLFSLIGYAQQKAVSGIVTDVSGQPLPGANVNVYKTNRSTITNFDGSFSISASEGEILEISFISFVSSKVTIGKSKTYTIQLKENISSLDEVVVVGYGSQKKVNLTGSVATVTFKENVNQPVTNSGQLLYGRFSGVQLTQTSGSPGADASSVVIRGIGTFGNTAPLVVIDNIQYEDLVAFNNLAPSDIESISVLKDASASAIYGARAANGVIIVNTRKGKEDKHEINYNSYFGVQDATVAPDFLGALDYANLINEKFRNQNGPNFLPRYTVAQIDAISTGSLPDQFANTNWTKAILKPASVQNHNLALSGGNSKSNYRLSLGYLGQDAIIKSKLKSERYNLSFNFNSKLNDWFSLSNVSNVYWKKVQGPTGGQEAFDGDNGIIYQFQRTAPTTPLFYSNGNYGIVDGAYLNANASLLSQNPLRRGFFGNYVSNVINASQRIGFTFKLSNHFSFETSGSANVSYSKTSDFSPTANETDWAGNVVILGLLNTLKNSTNLEYRLLNENILRYTNVINKDHTFGALLGHSVTYFREESFNGQLSGFPTDNIEEFNGGGVLNPAVAGAAGEDAYQSFFGRINYDFKGKYLAEFNLRRDGTSIVGPTNAYGNFPSGSVGWRISEEGFMQKLSFINNLKLRASWGISGNSKINRGGWEQTYNPNVDYVLGDNLTVVGVAVTSLANPFLRWEKTEQYDIGLDIDLLKNKIEFIADYFNRKSSDILYTNFPVPNTLGVTNLTARNSASMTNEGLELGLNYRGTIGKAKFSVGANITKFLNNEVTGLGDGGEETIGNFNIIRIGAPFRAYYGYKAIGIFQNINEVANAPVQFSNANTAPGDIRYADISGPNGVPDGIVNADDRTIIGNPNPDLLINFNGTFDYAGFDFNFLLQGVSGVDRLLMGNGALPMADDRSNVLTYWLDRWTPANPSSNLPRLGGQNNTEVSSFYIQDASYLRLKNIEFGYSLPKEVITKLNIAKLRLFVGAQNIITLTGLENFDPEGGTGNQSDRNPPLYKTVTFGMNLKL